MGRKRLAKTCYEMIVILAANVVVLSAPCRAQSQHRDAVPQDLALKKFLQEYVGPPTDENKMTGYSAVFVDLREHGAQEAIVYLTGPWCGTGGCTMLIVAPEDKSYRLITKVPIVRPPISVLKKKSNGWHDIGVVVAGGGIESGYQADLSFDGKTYPSNPSVPPSRRLKGRIDGKIVMNSTAKEKPLYP